MIKHTESRLINNLEIPQFIKDCNKVTCIKDKKYPIGKWNVKNGTVKDIDMNKYNCGIVCGANNNLFILDIDEKDDGILKFKEYLKDNKLNTFTVKTPNNGKHYYFKLAHKNKELDLLIKTELKSTLKVGGVGIDLFSYPMEQNKQEKYIMSPYSSFNGKEYKISKNIEPVELPESLIEWLIELKQTNKKEIIISDKLLKKAEKQNKICIEVSQYNYQISDKELEKIFDTINKDYIEKRFQWLIFTAICKNMNKFEMWDKYSKKTTKNNYVYTDNVIYWNNSNLNIDINYFCELLGLDRIEKYKRLQSEAMDIKTKIVDKKYLNIDPKIFRKYDKIIIKSCTGTGKTTNTSKNLKIILDENKDLTVLSIVNLISLATQQIKTFKSAGIELINYQNAKENEIMNKNSVICINSLVKLSSVKAEYFKNKIVYIDEINNLLECVTHNDSLNSSLRCVFETLLKIISNCHKIIVSDATINNNVLNLLNKKKSEKQILINNTFKGFKDIKASKYNDENKFFDRLILETKNNKSFSVACDSCTEAEKIEILLKKYKANKNIYCITSKSNFKYNDIQDPNNAIIIYSPSINTGVDINLDNETIQFIHIKGVSVNSISLYQMATRTRKQKELIYFSKVGERESKYDTLKECRKAFSDINKENEKIINMASSITEDDERKVINNTFFKLYTYNEYKNDTLNSNITLHFENILTEAGFEIIKNKGEGIIGLNKIKTVELKKDLKIKHENEFIDNIKEFDNLKEDHDFKKKCEILGITTKEQAEENKFVLEDNYKLTSFFNIQKLMKTDEYLKEKTIDNNINSFKIKHYNDTTTKTILLRNFEKKYKINKLDIHLNDFDITKVEHLNENEIKHYQNIFRSTKSKLDTKYDVQKYYVSMIKNITGELNIIQTKKTKNKERKDIYVYNYNKDLIVKIFDLTKLKDEYYTNYVDEILNRLNVDKPIKPEPNDEPNDYDDLF